MKLEAISILSVVLLAGAAQAESIATPMVERLAADRVAVTWSDRDPVDVFLADRPDTNVKTARLVSGRDADGRYEMTVPAGRPYFLLRDAKTGEVVRVAERLMPLEHGSNFRDVGGYPAAGGKHVRWGLIYRSGGQPLLTEADVKAVQALGVVDLVDLRSSEERVIAPTKLNGIRYSAVGYSLTSLLPQTNGQQSLPQNGGAVYRAMPTLLAPQLRILFADLLANKGPVVYNCSAGQDRTGFATAMVLTALGVPRDVIIADYHLSTTYRRPENEMPKIDAATAAANPIAKFFAQYQTDPRAAQPQPLKDPDGKAFLSYAFEEVEARYGSVDGYLEKEVGVSKLDLVRLRAAYLE